ncbi:MAG: hypothetical protein IB617_00335 [Candidatus Nealsonbacteria bacterium]|nr:MAG: hypothetical protein IB617_00335 [Candidatus Nealsonbacteria bacterium]
MNKKLILLTGVLFVIGVGTLFFFQYFNQAETSPRELSPITDEELRKIFAIARQHTGQKAIEMYGDFLKEDHLVNLVHIVKEPTGYWFSCRFGPAYQTANLNKYFPQQSVSMGQIKECNLDTAKAIDEAVRSSGKNCRVFIESENGNLSQLTDYYFFAITLREEEITQEWIDRTQRIKCLEPLKNLLGETVATHFVTGIVDLNENIIYY